MSEPRIEPNPLVKPVEKNEPKELSFEERYQRLMAVELPEIAKPKEKEPIQETTFEHYKGILGPNVPEAKQSAQEFTEAWAERQRRIKDEVAYKTWKEYYELSKQAMLLEEKLGFFDRDYNKRTESIRHVTQALAQAARVGKQVEFIPAFDEEHKNIGYDIYQTQNETIAEYAAAKAKIELHKLDRELNSFYYEEEEKEQQFQDKVRNGEMVYLGEMSFQEYLKKTEDFPNVYLLERIWEFDENKQPRKEPIKLYAYLKMSE